MFRFVIENSYGNVETMHIYIGWDYLRIYESGYKEN